MQKYINIAIAIAGKQEKLIIQIKSIKTAMITLFRKLMIFTDLTFWIMITEENYLRFLKFWKENTWLYNDRKIS